MSEITTPLERSRDQQRVRMVYTRNCHHQRWRCHTTAIYALHSSWKWHTKRAGRRTHSHWSRHVSRLHRTSPDHRSPNYTSDGSSAVRDSQLRAAGTSLPFNWREFHAACLLISYTSCIMFVRFPSHTFYALLTKPTISRQVSCSDEGLYSSWHKPSYSVEGLRCIIRGCRSWICCRAAVHHGSGRLRQHVQNCCRRLTTTE